MSGHFTVLLIHKKKRKHVVVVPSFFTFALSKGVIVFRILMFERMSPGVTTFNP